MLILTTALTLALAAPAQAQHTAAPPDPQEQTAELQDQQAEPQEPRAPSKEPPPTPPHTGVRALFGNLGEDFKHLPAMQNVYIAAIGGGLALAAHPADQAFNAKLLSHYDTVNTIFAPGKYLGDTPEQVALSLATYAVGRLRDQPKVAHLGMDLLQAQILSEILVEPLKFAVHRERPDGSDHQSFPSGHASVTFAAATVIERHLGWKKSVLGYAIASYVAMSRVHDNRHYLSDVIFGAAVGSIAGRTVVHHEADYWAFTPAPVPGGGVALMVSRTRWRQ
jgi:membrane-associated phospholipid phosphatase